MQYRNPHVRPRARAFRALIVFAISFAGCSVAAGVLSAEPGKGALHAAPAPVQGDAAASGELAPVEIRDVDLADYPRVRVMFSAASPYPRFVARDDAPGFRLSEAYGDAEWPVFNNQDASDVAEGSASPGGTGRAPALRTIRVAAERLNLVVIVDSTKSMPAKAFRAALSTARSLAAGLGSGDRMALYSFAGEPQLLSGFTGDKEKLERKLSAIKRQGKITRVFDTLYSGLYTAQKALGSLNRSAADFNRPPAGESRTMVLLLTDARDEDSFLNDEDCLKLSELGRRMSIPIYVGLYGRAQDSQPRLLKRLTLITGGELLSNPQSAQAPDLLREFRRLPRAYYEIAYDSPAAVHGTVYPGAKVRQRIALLANGSEYANVFDYRVPFWSWWQMQLFTLNGLLFVLILLICILLMLIFWLLNRSRERSLAPVRETRIPPLGSGTGEAGGSSAPGGGDVAATAASYRDEDAEDAPDIAPYLLAGHQDVVPGTVVSHGEPAGVLMDDERTLYMREYTYRTTQMAVRQGIKYRRASMILELRGGESNREYDLFLETTVIGSGRWANIPLRDDTVSAVHAKIKRVDERFIIYDLLSAGGVYLNGRKLLRPRALRDGDQLRLGRARFQFRGVR